MRLLFFIDIVTIIVTITHSNTHCGVTCVGVNKERVIAAASSIVPSMIALVSVVVVLLLL